MTQALQDIYAPQNKCFGCGPKNEKGLRIKSFVEGEFIVATFRPEPHHEAWEGVVNGGIVGCLFDCHSNWAAAYHLMKKAGTDDLPPTVTADFHVKRVAVTEPIKGALRRFATMTYVFSKETFDDTFAADTFDLKAASETKKAA